MTSKEEQEREDELAQAIQNMEDALEKANGNCAKRVKRRTTATRRALIKIAKEDPVDDAD